MTENMIYREITINAPMTKVWKALTDHTQFSQWFGAEIAKPFKAGEKSYWNVTCAKKDYGEIPMDTEIVAIDPEHYFAYRWHPFAVDKSIDYSKEKMTLVEFHLETTGKGTKVKVKESGFADLPAARREAAFGANSAGWAKQMENLTNYAQQH